MSRRRDQGITGGSVRLATVIGRFDGSEAQADALRAEFNRQGDTFWVKMLKHL